MSTNNRIKLSVPEAAAHGKWSVSTLYRKAQTEPGFPQPHKSDNRHKSNGKPQSFWYKDELDTYIEKQEPRNVLRKRMLDLARRCADRAISSSNSSHPVVRAFLLAGGNLPLLAVETGYDEEVLHRLYERGGLLELDNDALLTLYSYAIKQILRQEHELREGAIANPSLIKSADFRNLLLDLNEAHTICFGQSLMDFLLKEHSKEGGHENGNA